MKRAIEETFPIVEINRLTAKERCSFKPVYQMHKWFARRASCVFRAILLASMKPAGTDIMEEFYKDHKDDPDTNGIKILDPFMGGGTTIIEALRLGCHVTGNDLNPVAWFIVKAEAESVDIDELKEAFERLANRTTTFGSPLKDELLSYYKTECPCCGEDTHTIYTFWVKSAICTNPTCRKEVSLFSDYLVAHKSPSIRYVPDYECPQCGKSFDLDVEAITLIPDQSLCIDNPQDSAGLKRGNKRWCAIDNISGKSVCPWCDTTFHPKRINDKNVKKERKKVPLTAILCPGCHSVWQMRGSIPNDVKCPTCHLSYDPKSGNMVGNGSFICPDCGNKDSVIKSLRRLDDSQLLSMKAYAIEGYCPKCAGKRGKADNNLFGETVSQRDTVLDHKCGIFSRKGKFIGKLKPSDLRVINNCDKKLKELSDTITYPTGEIPVGFNTNQMIKHNYRYWNQMFNSRQILCLSQLIQAIEQEGNESLKLMLLSAFQMCLEANNMFARYRVNSGGRSPFGGLFARHDFQPKLTPCEINVFGPYPYYGTYIACASKVIEGKEYCSAPTDRRFIGDKQVNEKRNERIEITESSELSCNDSRNLTIDKVDLVITDPPYAGNVNYSELADFFYVWLRLSLGEEYPQFSPAICPKVDEIVENPIRGISTEDYEHGLSEVWKKCIKSLADDGLLVFTFHHSEGSAWEALLESLCDSGFVIEAIYPIHSESESSLQLMGKQAISYDLIHVCKERTEENGRKRSWAGVRQEIRRKAREEITLIESGRYGEGQLLEADVNIVLTGKCLELYSKHYGNIVDYKNEVVPLSSALNSIRMMVEQLVNQQNPLPSELENIDPVSYVYLTCLCDRKEIKSDEVRKSTLGIMEPDVLLKAGVIIKGRGKRGRTYHVKLPNERIKDLEKTFGKRDKYAGGQAFLFPEMEQEWFDNIPLVDVIHYLMALAIVGENIAPWLNTFKTVLVPVRVALKYLMQRNPTFQDPIQKVMNLIEV